MVKTLFQSKLLDFQHHAKVPLQGGFRVFLKKGFSLLEPPKSPLQGDFCVVQKQKNLNSNKRNFSLKSITILFIFFFPILLFSQKTITTNFQNLPLEEVLTELEQDHEIVFSYTSELIENQLITVEINNQNLENSLILIFQNTSIDYEIVNETYVILKRKELNIPEVLVCGKVVDEDQVSLPFANVVIRKNSEGTSTDEDGNFEWQSQVLPNDTIEVRYVGFQTKKIAVKDLKNCPLITLKLQSSTFSEIVVKEYITAGIEQSEDLNHLVLRPAQLDVVPGLTEADVLQMIQILPGVQSPDESATGLHIRGGTPDQNLILWDGIPVYNSGHFFGMLSAFNPYIVDNVKVYRGGFGSEYGGRVAGVIDISSENKIPKKVKADVGINFTHADASVVIPLLENKSALILSARRAYTDITETPTYQKLSGRVFQKGKINEQQSLVEEGDDELDVFLNFVFNDLNAKWLYQPNAKDKISVSAFGIYDKLEFASISKENDLTELDNLDLDNVGFSGQWQRQWRQHFTSNVRLSYTNFESNYKFNLGVLDSIDAETELERLQLNTVEDLSFQWNNNWQIRKNLKLNFGYQFSDLKVNTEFQWEDDLERDITIGSVKVHMPYFTLSPSFGNQLKMDIGLRASIDQLSEVTIWEPRFSLFYLPNKNWQFKFSSGNYRQFVSQVLELNDLGLNEQIWVLPSDDEEFPIVENESVSLGVLYHRPDFQVEIEGYRKRLQNLSLASPAFLNSNTNTDEDPFETGSGKVLGVDVLLKKRWSDYQTWLSYSWNRIQYEFEAIGFGQTFSAPHERPHSLTSVHMLKYKNWQFSSSWKFASGKVYTEAEGIDEDEGEPAYPEDQINNSRLPAYHRLDASILYKVQPKKKGMEGMIGMSFLNIYNRRNLLSRQYRVEEDDDIGELELVVLDRPLLGFTPNIVFRWSWK